MLGDDTGAKAVKLDNVELKIKPIRKKKHTARRRALSISCISQESLKEVTEDVPRKVWSWDTTDMRTSVVELLLEDR